MNHDRLIKNMIADTLAFAVPIEIDDLDTDTVGGYGLNFFDSDEREYAEGRYDTLIELLDKAREDLSTKVFELAKNFAVIITTNHPDWLDPDEYDLEQGGPWLEYLAQDGVDIVKIVDDFYLDLISGN